MCIDMCTGTGCVYTVLDMLCAHLESDLYERGTQVYTRSQTQVPIVRHRVQREDIHAVRHPVVVVVICKNDRRLLAIHGLQVSYRGGMKMDTCSGDAIDVHRLHTSGSMYIVLTCTYICVYRLAFSMDIFTDMDCQAAN